MSEGSARRQAGRAGKGRHSGRAGQGRAGERQAELPPLLSSRRARTHTRTSLLVFADKIPQAPKEKPHPMLREYEMATTKIALCIRRIASFFLKY